MPPHVLVLHNIPVLPPDHPDADSEHDILYTADLVAKIVDKAGYPVSKHGAGTDPASVLDGLARHRPDVVFNLFEGTATAGQTEPVVAGLLEWLGVPFTGSPAGALWLARNKPLTKQLLAGAGLPTPEFFVCASEAVPPCPLEWPVIVKPALEDASVGIEQASVVTGQKQLADRVRHVVAHYGAPVLVERFVAGREFNVGLVETPAGLEMLPLGEILFVDQTPGYWPIVSFDAKWKPGTRDFTATPPAFPEVGQDLRAALYDVTTRAFRTVGCRDYARVDVRVDAAGRPFILEVNPNPCVSDTAGLAASVEAAGRTHADFILGVLRAAVSRGRPTLERRAVG